MTLSFNVGNLRLHRVVEQEQPFFDPLKFFPDLKPEVLEENRSWLEESALDPRTGFLNLCIQSYVVRTPHHTILIDSCVGNDKQRPARPFWHMMSGDSYMRSLAAHGLTVDDIDFVMCTHLHTDHVGWNTRLENGRWVPTFPKARYLFADLEFDFWKAKNEQEPVPWIVDSVLPIVAAGRAQLVSSAYALDDNVRLEPTPGHTIDHYSVHLTDGHRKAVVTGDMIHSPLQCRYPELSAFVDYDGKQSAETRRAFLGRHCDTDTLICTAHFPSPSIGHITRWDDTFRFVPTSG